MPVAVVVSLVAVCPPAAATGTLPMPLPQYLQLTPTDLAMDFAAAQKAGATMPSPSDVELARQTYAFTQITPSGVVFDQAGALEAGVRQADVVQLAASYDRINEIALSSDIDWGRLLELSSQRQMAGRRPGVSMNGQVSRGWDWWGPYDQASFSEYETKMILNTLKGVPIGTGGYVALSSLLKRLGLAALPEVEIVGLVTFLFTATAYALSFIDDLGGNKGLYFRVHTSWVGGPVKIVTVWHN